MQAAMPTPELLRQLATYVDVEELRQIDDSDLLARRFGELRAHLLRWATVLEATDETV